jgi:hypothetical protein
MTRRLLLLAVALAVAAAVWLAGSLPGTTSIVRVPVPSSPGRGVTPAPRVESGHPEIGFQDRSHLEAHYRKHGAEFGDISEAEYLRRAQALRDRPAVGEVLEGVRRDGVVTRFDRRGGEFLAFERDLTIRTFFRPNQGVVYFDRQLKRGQSVP